MARVHHYTFALLIPCLIAAPADAAVTVFFDGSQGAFPVAEGVTSDTIRSHGYLFTYTRDKLFTGGYGQTEPIGRMVRVPWPLGVEAQAVTTGPVLSKARIDISRVDGARFDVTALSFKLLANTAGAGANLEIMPMLDGEDAFNDPLYFLASGYAGQVFSYDQTPNYWGSTASLHDFHGYKLTLYVDYALVALTLQSAAVPGDSDGDLDVDDLDRAALEACGSGPAIALAAGCETKDLDFDNDVDSTDFAILQRCFTGDGNPGDPNCAG